MTVANWLSPTLMGPLGWALFHFLWQGTALAVLATVAIALFRRSSARYLVAVIFLVFMLAAPVATFFSYWQTNAGSPSTATAALVPAWEITRSTTAVRASATSQRVPVDIFPGIVEAWLAGVVFFSLRTAGGFFALERMRRRRSLDVTDRLLGTCLVLQHRLGLDRAIRYCHCAWLDAPAVIGWFRPVVLLPITALTGLSEAQLQAVIAHELAHIKRYDAFVNAFQVAVETVLFYHPAVWWLNKRIRAERENCCDDTAIALCGNALDYARALTLMEEWRGAPALAMAANRGPLTDRITRLLGIKSLSSGLRGTGVATGVLCLTAALVAGNAFFGIAHTAHAQATPAVAPASSSSHAQPTKSTPSTKPTPARNPVAAEATESGTARSYIDEMKSAGLGDITVDLLIALKIQGVTPQYVRGLQEQGLHPGADDLIAMKVQGITPDYVRELRATGVTVSDEELIATKVQGVDAAYVRGLQGAGLHPNADELIGMKVQGVTPEYVRGLQEQGVKFDADELVGMKVQGVTPEYVREIRALGLNPDADGLVSMRVQGVTPDYIKMLQSGGFKFDVDDVVSAKVQGITPEFIEKARKHGFQNLSLEKLIELKHTGILEAPGDI